MQEQIEAIRAWLGQGAINLFGMPFAGKDTQGAALADLLHAELLGGGTILRGSQIPDRVRHIMDAGKLIPTEDYIQIVLPYLSRTELAGKPLLLSSVGRWHGEEEGVLQATEQSGHPLKAVIYLSVTEEVARARHAAGAAEHRGVRADDHKDALSVRLEEFRAKTLPVIEYYRDKKLLIEVDGALRPAQVTEHILQQLAALSTSRPGV